MDNGNSITSTWSETDVDDARRLISSAFEDVSVGNEAETYSAPMETQTGSPFEVQVYIGEGIDQLRAQASEAVLPREKGFRILRLFMEQSRPLRERLIDQEAHLGAGLFSKVTPVQRFWYQDGGEWFYEQGDEAATQKIRYVVSQDEVLKFVEGRLSRFTEGELERFTEAVTSYDSVVRQELYEARSFGRRR